MSVTHEKVSLFLEILRALARQGDIGPVHCGLESRCSRGPDSLKLNSDCSI